MKSAYKALAATVLFLLAATGAGSNARAQNCLYNNSEQWLQLSRVKGDSASDAFVGFFSGTNSSIWVPPGYSDCYRSDPPPLFTMYVEDDKERRFCPMPFSTGKTTVTVISDENEPTGLRCCRDCGPDWKG